MALTGSAKPQRCIRLALVPSEVHIFLHFPTTLGNGNCFQTAYLSALSQFSNQKR